MHACHGGDSCLSRLAPAVDDDDDDKKCGVVLFIHFLVFGRGDM